MMKLPNGILQWVQAAAALLLLAVFALVIVGPMFGLAAPASEFGETLKNVVLIVVGFLFGSSLGSSKKDDAAIAAAQANE